MPNNLAPFKQEKNQGELKKTNLSPKEVEDEDNGSRDEVEQC